MRRVGLLLCVAACGRTGFDVVADARTSVPDALGGCWPSWRSHAPAPSSPQAVAELVTPAAEGDPSLTADALTMYFARSNPAANDLFVTTRPTRQSAWGPASPVAELNSVEDETKLTLTADALLAVWAVSRNGTLDYDLWQATRTSPTAAFTALTQAPLQQVNDTNAQYDPQLSSDGLRLYLAPSLTTRQHIQVASRATLADAFGAPVDVLDLGTMDRADPTLSPDELVIVFSARTTAGGPTSLWYATRDAITSSFANAQPIPGIAPGPDEFHQDPMVSFDGCELYFSNHTATISDLFVSTIE